MCSRFRCQTQRWPFGDYLYNYEDDHLFAVVVCPAHSQLPRPIANRLNVPVVSLRLYHLQHLQLRLRRKLDCPQSSYIHHINHARQITIHASRRIHKNRRGCKSQDNLGWNCNTGLTATDIMACLGRMGRLQKDSCASRADCG